MIARPVFNPGNLKITHISDGDSLRSGNLRIRLFGIDAPEKSRNALTWMVGNGIAGLRQKKR